MLILTSLKTVLEVKPNLSLHLYFMSTVSPYFLPSSVRFISCSISREVLGRVGGTTEGCNAGRSSTSLKLASISCSFDLLGPGQKKCKGWISINTVKVVPALMAMGATLSKEKHECDSNRED